MKRPAGAIPPLTDEGTQTLIGKKLPVRTLSNPGKVRWRKVEVIKYLSGDDAILGWGKSWRSFALSRCRFDPEDALVASVRRERFLAKLNGSA